MAHPDYRSLIDDATWTFIRKTEAAYPSDTASRSIQEQRDIYDAMCRSFNSTYAQGITATDKRIGGVACRVYCGAQPRVIYVHGGGFVVGNLDSHDGVCADLAAHTGLEVVSLDYRLSPEHLHPAAFNDVLDVVRALEGSMVLVGDSAGANLVAAVCHLLRTEVRIFGQVLIYPLLGGDCKKGSYQEHAFAPLLSLSDVEFYSAVRHGEVSHKWEPTAFPLHDTSFEDLPPTVTFAAEFDPLADDAHDYAATLRAAGGRAQSFTAQGLVHGYLRARKTVPRAAQSFSEICQAIKALSQSRWPW